MTMNVVHWERDPSKNPPDLPAFTRDALEVYQDVKRVQVEGVGPMILLEFGDGEMHLAPSHVRGDAVSIVGKIKAAVPLPLRRLAFLSDQYGLEVQPPAVVGPGDATNAFIAGDPNAYELLAAIAYDGVSLEAWRVKYVASNGVVTFDALVQETTADWSVDGIIPDSVRAAFDAPVGS